MGMYGDLANGGSAPQTPGDLIRDFKIAMLTTATPDGALRSRPMATLPIGADGLLWFFTSWDSGKVHDLLADAHVNVSYADPERGRFVSVSGRATLVRDREKAEALWEPTQRAWFPHGPEDPDLVLLQVRVEHSEYWDAAVGAMTAVTWRAPSSA